MIRTGEEYIESIRDGRAVYANGERVIGVTSHLLFNPYFDTALLPIDSKLRRT